MHVGKLHARLYKTDRARDFDHEQDRVVRMRQIYETIDRQGYQWIVVLVAGLGFFLDGYTLFASNMALPMISYVYWNNEISSLRLTCINIATLAGTLLGMVMFGFLADKNGRKKMYGVELVLLITATLGVVMSSEGVNKSMNVYAWLIWWRICVGIGVGADYPLSAVITSEFAPTKHRARMMASVFFAQPLGQIAGNLVSIVVIAIGRSSNDADIVGRVDKSPRFLVDIEDDPVTAEFDATTLFSEPPSSPGGMHVPPVSSLRSNSIIDDDEFGSLPPATLNSHWRLARTDIMRYFWTEGNWRSLVATSVAWLLMDFGFYGISLASPQFLARTWGQLQISKPEPYWKISEDPNFSVFQGFFDTSVRALVILNIGSFAGGLLFIIFAHRIDRVALQKYMFLLLAVLFIVLGSMFVCLIDSPPAAVALYILGQIMFNFGPNATTYMIPAEIFPTRYRATCYGIAAGSGKLGSILVQIFSTYYKFGGGLGNISTRHHGIVLFVFSIWKGRNLIWGGKPYTLEVMALGRMGHKSREAGPGPRKRTSRQRTMSVS
ncbi:hypothetical protein N7470_004662 [Penicillium chermesinum]|nr:hypothetical protein N7470_004662 [Penicillium chermesinum]